MTLLGSRSVTRSRYPVGSWGADGEYSLGTLTSSTIVATVQPLNGHDRQMLPEGFRERITRKLYTEDADGFRTVDQKAGTAADRVTFDSATWEVFRVDEQDEYGSTFLNHHRCWVVQLDESTT